MRIVSEMVHAPHDERLVAKSQSDLTGSDANRVSGVNHGSQGKSELTLLGAELQDIGRNARSIKPAALAGRSTLLRCARVARKKGSTTSEAALLQAAHDALADAIKAMPTPTDRVIAEAILAATSEFEDKNVDERKRLLATKYHIGETTFKRRRPKIVQLLVAYLVSDEGEAPFGTTLIDHAQACRDMATLFRDTHAVRYAFGALSFARYIDRHCSDSWPSDWAGERVIGPIADVIWKRCVSLSLATTYCFSDAQYSDRRRMIANFPDELVNRLSGSLETVFAQLDDLDGKRQEIQDSYFTPSPSLGERRRLERQSTTPSISWNNRVRSLSDEQLGTIDDACEQINQASEWVRNNTEWQRGLFSKIHLIEAGIADYLGADVSSVEKYLAENRVLGPHETTDRDIALSRHLEDFVLLRRHFRLQFSETT